MTRTETAGYWASIDRQRARIAAHRAEVADRRGHALREIAAASERRASDPMPSTMPDRDICQLAERRAEEMARRIARLSEPMTTADLYRWLLGHVQALGADKLPPLPSCESAWAEALQGVIARVQCPLWWRRKLRRAVVRKRETEAVYAVDKKGEWKPTVGQGQQWYCTDDTVARRVQQCARNAAILEQTVIESEDGEQITLAEAAAASVANKAIRRGELMTRIRGCEELAEAFGMVGIFTTNTCPSRFHPTSNGAANPKHYGEYGPVQPNRPNDAQRWLCRTWARARAALHRLGLAVFGFRVAEPHADGCPHWHMLLWCKPEHVQEVERVLRRYWLAENGTEAGAWEHRFKCKRMEKGGASGYVAKYIAKGIDDAGAIGEEGHYDEDARMVADAQGELIRNPAKRVEAWAAAWGIRQFQPIGQPPVTVWRELRRVKPEALGDASERIVRAWEAAHRHGQRRADWARYVIAQGGLMNGRRYLIHIAAELREQEGRYELKEVERPVGVEDKLRPGEWVLSDRREWKPRGQWQRSEQAVPKAPRAAWTRFNNCTQVAGATLQKREPLRTWREQIEFQSAPEDRRAATVKAWRERFKGKPDERNRQEGASA